MAMAGETELLRQRVKRKFVEEINKSFYTDENETDISRNGLPARKSKPDKPKSVFTVENVCWLIAAVVVFYLTDFYQTLVYDIRVKSLWLNIGCLLILVTLTIALFLIIYLSYVKKVDSDEWEKHYPAAIPLATASFAFGSFCVTVSLWPVWSILTPVILFTIFMAFVVIISWLPNF